MRFKSSHSLSDVKCVEVAFIAPTVDLRDSDRSEGCQVMGAACCTHQDSARACHERLTFIRRQQGVAASRQACGRAAR
ncbi:DUF397 domain-containing protein [Lentzea sp. NPDC042327]|uniref:DUF397 domain-containing protein n=1 Tax=Lentzea sp. NPDC042327 TaxID=3154801 RepID=UPI0034059598